MFPAQLQGRDVIIGADPPKAPKLSFRPTFAHFGGACLVATVAGSVSAQTPPITSTTSNWKWHSVCTQPASQSDDEVIFGGPESYTARRC